MNIGRKVREVEFVPIRTDDPVREPEMPDVLPEPVPDQAPEPVPDRTPEPVPVPDGDPVPVP